MYTLARDAYDTGLPITGALYLQWPGLAAAYEHPSEYTFGPDMVVEPVTASGDPAPATIWVPPGQMDRLLHRRPTPRPRTVTLSVPLSSDARAGPRRVDRPDRAVRAVHHAGPAEDRGPDRVPGDPRSFRLYDDQGAGFGYQRGAFTWTPIVYRRHGVRSTLTIGPARGRFPGAPATRSWVVRFLATGGRGMQTVTTGPEPTDRRTTVTAP